MASTSAVCRRGLAHLQPRLTGRGGQHLLVSRRFLGDSVRGPLVTDIQANARYAKEFFTKGAISYAEYKQQCVSLRLFAFAGVTGGCALALILDPPKSSYWRRYSVTYWPTHLKNIFWGSAPPVLLTSKLTHEVDVQDAVATALFGAKDSSAASSASAALPPKKSEVAVVAPPKKAVAPAEPAKPTQTSANVEPEKPAAAAPSDPLFCLNVKVVVKPERREEFLKLILADQKGTLNDEPLAVAFVVGEDVDMPNTFYLHEQYKGRAGFEAHTKTPHAAEAMKFLDSEALAAPPVAGLYLAV